MAKKMIAIEARVCAVVYIIMSLWHQDRIEGAELWHADRPWG
jgi:hypothetical protein